MATIRLRYVNSFSNRDRKNVRVRYYFRRRGEKAIPLPGQPGSEEFMAAYGMALAAIPHQPEIGASRTLSGSINALVVDYYRSAEWQHGLAEQTKRVRRGIIERFRAKHGDKRVALLRREHIEKMLEQVTKPAVKNDWLKAIRGLLRFAVPTMLKADPTVGITVKLPKSRGHHTWTDEEIEQYRAYWPLGTQQRLVMEFALETASRRGEVVRLGPQHVRNGRIRIERTKGSDDVDIPMSPELQAACEAMPKGHLTYIVTAYGKPRSKHGLGIDFARWVSQAELPARCRLHGLKKAGMRRRAEAGNTAHELMAFSGHKTLAEVQRYTETASKKKLADSGFAKMQGTKGDDTYTNAGTLLHKQGEKARNIKG